MAKLGMTSAGSTGSGTSQHTWVSQNPSTWSSKACLLVPEGTEARFTLPTYFFSFFKILVLIIYIFVI